MDSATRLILHGQMLIMAELATQAEQAGRTNGAAKLLKESILISKVLENEFAKVRRT